ARVLRALGIEGPRGRFVGKDQPGDAATGPSSRSLNSIGSHYSPIPFGMTAFFRCAKKNAAPLPAHYLRASATSADPTVGPAGFPWKKTL
ncbi:MAG: hypothetical protein V4710_00675, partial [Verrucomicrobiota bacterium]